MKHRELLVGRRGEAPLVPPYILPSFKQALALEFAQGHRRVHLEVPSGLSKSGDTSHGHN